MKKKQSILYKTLPGFLISCIILISAPAQSDASFLSSQSASLTIKVSDPESIAEDLINKAETYGGYFTQQTEQTVQLNLPSDKVNDYLGYAETKGLVVNKEYNANDLSGELEEKQTRLKAKEAVLKQYLQVLNTAKQSGIISVEKAVIRLVDDIERLKGSIKFIEHKIHFAVISFTFQFHDRTMPVSPGDSSFQWLNTMNLQDMIQDFQYEK
jgi:hypothetical protein